MRQAGRYLPEYREVRAHAGSFLDLCYAPELAAEVTLQPIRRYGFDAAILFSDILVVPHGLGQEVRFVEGEGPRLSPIRTADALSALSIERMEDGAGGILAPVYDAVRRIRTMLPDGCALIGFAGAPWTVAAYMVEGGGSRDFQAIKQWAYGDPDGFQGLIDLLVAATVRHLSNQIAAGAEVVQIFDSHSGVLPAEAFARWVIAPTARIVAALRAAHPDVPVIGFPRGAGMLYERYLRETGVQAVSLDTVVPPSWARERLGSSQPLQGNLDPIALLVGGAAMTDAVDGICDVLGSGPFVFNLGHGIVKETPPENVAALVAYLRGKRRG
jgi:uroporphyrinogen decarboxylase